MGRCLKLRVRFYISSNRTWRRGLLPLLRGELRSFSAAPLIPSVRIFPSRIHSSSRYGCPPVLNGPVLESAAVRNQAPRYTLLHCDHIPSTIVSGQSACLRKRGLPLQSLIPRCSTSTKLDILSPPEPFCTAAATPR